MLFEQKSMWKSSVEIICLSLHILDRPNHFLKRFPHRFLASAITMVSFLRQLFSTPRIGVFLSLRYGALSLPPKQED